MSVSHSFGCAEVGWEDAIERAYIRTMAATRLHKLDKMERRRKAAQVIGSHRNAAARRRRETDTATSE
jgi:hypothetical protein